MSRYHTAKQAFLLCVVVSTSAQFVCAREWTDVSGRHSWAADLLAASEELVVLKDKTGELQAVQVHELSDSDKAFVSSYLKESGSRVNRNIQTWTMQSGLKVKGNVLGYKSGPVEIENRGGIPYVNRKRYRDIDPVYQAMLPKLVAAADDDTVETVADFKAWVRLLRRTKRTITVDGVLLQLESGDDYAVPLFLFSEPDRKVLENGWRQWSAEDATREQKKQEDVLIRAEAAEYHRREARAQQDSQIRMMQLGLLAVDAGITSLWEVQMAPGRGTYGRPMKVVVPANDSLAAQRAAMQRHPGYVTGASRQISRR